MADVNLSGIDLQVQVGGVVFAALGQEIPDGQIFWKVSLDDINLPFSSFYLVLKSGKPDYLRVTCPLNPAVADAVYDHPDGTLKIVQGVKLRAGGEVAMELSSVLLSGIYEAAGANSKSVNLGGTAVLGTTGSSVHELRNLTFKSDSNGVLRFRMVPNVMVLPDDTIIDPETRISYAAHQVICYATANRGKVTYFMEVTTG